jgi:hypothetical protein
MLPNEMPPYLLSRLLSTWNLLAMLTVLAVKPALTPVESLIQVIMVLMRLEMDCGVSCVSFAIPSRSMRLTRRTGRLLVIL